MQNWSCGYYLLYFAPFAPIFVVHRMWVAGKLKDAATWLSLVGAAIVTLALTLPFLLPYTEAQQRYGFERPFGEIVLFSANVWSYVTAAEPLRLWGRALRFYPHGEGETFLGFVPWVLAVVAGVGAVRAAAAAPTRAPSRLAMRVLTWLLLAAVLVQGVAVLSAVVFGGFDTKIFGLAFRARTPVRLLDPVRGRRRAPADRLAARAPGLRPAVPIAGRCSSPAPRSWPCGCRSVRCRRPATSTVSGFGLYGVLYTYVPGFNGVRVPARYAMIAGLFLAAVAGFGAAEVMKWKRGALIVAVAGVLALLEGAAVPLDLNHAWAQNEAMPPSRVFPAAQAPPVYARVAALPDGAVITELPFGDAAWEIRYVYYSAAHWKPITNGYSGSFPPAYKRRVARLQAVGHRARRRVGRPARVGDHARRRPRRGVRQARTMPRCSGSGSSPTARPSSDASRMAIRSTTSVRR